MKLLNERKLQRNRSPCVSASYSATVRVSPARPVFDCVSCPHKSINVPAYVARTLSAARRSRRLKAFLTHDPLRLPLQTKEFLSA